MNIKEVLFGKRPRNKGYIARLLASLCFQWFGVTTVVIVWSALGLYSPWYFQLNVPVIARLVQELSIVAWFDIILSYTTLLISFQLLFLSILAGIAFLEEIYHKLHWVYDGWHISREGDDLLIIPPPEVARQTSTRLLKTPLPRYLCGKWPHYMDTMISEKWLTDALNQVEFPKAWRSSLSQFIKETQHWI